jgi:cation diffusion facilitator CzcD-associated flavoprotein CzcO
MGPAALDGMTLSCDVAIIVGGGICGLTLALQRS